MNTSECPTCSRPRFVICAGVDARSRLDEWIRQQQFSNVFVITKYEHQQRYEEQRRLAGWVKLRWTAVVSSYATFDSHWQNVDQNAKTFQSESCQHAFWRIQIFVAPFFQLLHFPSGARARCRLTSCGPKDMRLEVTQLLLENHQCVGCIGHQNDVWLVVWLPFFIFPWLLGIITPID